MLASHPRGCLDLVEWAKIKNSNNTPVVFGAWDESQNIGVWDRSEDGYLYFYRVLSNIVRGVNEILLFGEGFYFNMSYSCV